MRAENVRMPGVTTLGAKVKRSISRRCGRSTLETLTEPLPPVQEPVAAVPPPPVLTTFVRSDVESVVPNLFFPVTRTRTVWPTSPVRTPYVLPVAPLIAVQLPPSASHSCHSYEND